MHFPRYWARAQHQVKVDGAPVPLGCWRWSDVSMQEAQQRADAALQTLVEAYSRTSQLPDSYGYGHQPLREPVLRELQGPDGGMVGAITRNRHGCEVLSTTEAMFIDVDFHDHSAGPSLLQRLLQLFSGATPATPGMQQAHDWIERNPSWGLRVYRTAAGLRLLATHNTIAPDPVHTQMVFDALGTDPLYRRLCGQQQSYRARLTPKPWRCGSHAAVGQWPFRDGTSEAAFQRWLQDYKEKCEGFATCQFVEALGNPRVHPEIQPIVVLHDEATGAHSGLTLA